MNNVSANYNSYPVVHVNEENNAPALQAAVLDSIVRDNSREVFELLKGNIKDIYGDQNFLEGQVTPLLMHPNPRVRGLASLFLYKMVVDGGIELSSRILDDWKAAALKLELEDQFRTESTACLASIRVMGDQSYGDGEDEAYGVVIANAQPGTISEPVRRPDLDEHYLIISGIGKVWLNDEASGEEKVIELLPGKTAFIPRTSIIQFRNTGDDDLIFLVPTTPPYNVVAKKVGFENVAVPFPKGKW